MVTASVTANSRKSLPTTLPIKSSGINTAMSDTVNETNGESDLTGTCERRFQRGHSCLEKATDVLNHHDGVIHYETRGDGQRHQRQVVEEKPSRYIAAKVPTRESGTATLGMMVARKLRKKRKMTITTSPTVSSSSNSTSLTEA